MAAPWIVDDELWAVIEPLLPVRPPGTPGLARMDDRLVLQGHHPTHNMPPGPAGSSAQMLHSFGSSLTTGS